MAKKDRSGELKNWIMFLFALGILYGMFRRGDNLGPWWTLVIGAMLSLTSLMVAVENIMGLFKKGSNGNGNGKPGGSGSETPEGLEKPPDSSPHPGDSGLRKRDRSHPHQVALC